jgi:Fic family protein
MSEYKPPFHTTDKITNLVAAISEQIGRIKVLSHGNLNPYLRKENRIRTIHSSLAIEHNSLSPEQVTAIVDGKHILGNPNEIRGAKNAYDTYEMMERLDLSHRPTFRKNYLNPALAQGVIEMTIPDKPNSRNQRYRRK